jgi:probable HAF family extracellular repeat protein
MKSQQYLFTWIAAVALVCGLNAPSAAQHQPMKYYVFNLGAPLGGNPEPVGINDLGWISGGANLAGNNVVKAELWVGTPLNLGTLGGSNSNISWPNHSNHGEIVGIAETAEANPYHEPWSCFAFFPSATPSGHICLGFAWRNGVMSPLPALQGGYDSYAAGVNNAGQVVGWAEDGVHDPTCNAPTQVLQFEAVIWGPGLTEITQLPPYPGDPDSAATAINDSGEVVGISGLCSNAVGGASARHALLWRNGMPFDLGNIGGHAWNTPTALNNRGEIVGFANTSGDENAPLSPVAFLWTQETGKMEKLPMLDDDQTSAAYDINQEGQIVGVSNGGPMGIRAFLYENGGIHDLNALVVGDSPLYLLIAQGINSGGEIVGTAVDPSGQQVGFLAVPAYGDLVQAAALAESRERDSRNGIPSNFRPQLTGFSRLVVQAMQSQ